MKHAILIFVLLLLPRPARAGEPALTDYWPSQDGLRWQYDQFYGFIGLMGIPPETTESAAHLLFQGTCEVPGSIEVQSLTAGVSSGVSSPARPAGAPAEFDSPFRRSLRLARPDLQSRLLSAAAACPDIETPMGWDQLLLGPSAFRKTLTEIAAWRTNATSTRAWLWLADDLSPGAMFQLQLLPDLTTDVFLHGQVMGTETVMVPAGSFECLRVDYAVDYGQSPCTEPGNPDPLGGFFRGMTLGSVYYAPGVGPVKSTEEFIPFFEITGDCGDAVQGQVVSRGSLSLSAIPEPVRSVTWGAIKAAYR